MEQDLLSELSRIIKTVNYHTDKKFYLLKTFEKEYIVFRVICDSSVTGHYISVTELSEEVYNMVRHSPSVRKYVPDWLLGNEFKHVLDLTVSVEKDEMIEICNRLARHYIIDNTLKII